MKLWPLSPRTKFVLMFILFASPIALSYLMFFFWSPSTTSNFGALIRPVVTLPVERFVVTDGAELPPGAADTGLRGKWLLVTVDGAGCQQACQAKTYVMRQARLVAGKEQDRIARVVLLSDGQLPTAETTLEYAGAAWVDARKSAWIKAFPLPTAESRVQDFIYAVDPMGHLFMRYPADADIKKLAADLRRVLKASQLGKEFEGKIESVIK